MSHEETATQGFKKRARAKRLQNLYDKGWKHDDFWWFSPYTGIRYTLDVAMDIEYLRDEWSGEGKLDWTKRQTWANQWGNSEDE